MKRQPTFEILREHRELRVTSSQKARRSVNLHGTFAPDGGHMVGGTTFFQFWLEAQNRLADLGKKDLRRKKAAFKKSVPARRKALQLLNKMLNNETPVESGAEKLKRLLPDKQLRREIFDFWESAIKSTPEQLQKEQQRLARDTVRLRRDEKIFAARNAISRCVSTLNEMAIAGDEQAAEALVEAAYSPGLAIINLERTQSKMMERIAHRRTLWPVLTDGRPAWEKKAAERLSKLDLGAEMARYRARFRQPRGAEVQLPARKWARAAVRTIEDTRFRNVVFAFLFEEFGAVENVCDFMSEAGWDFGDTPGWVQEVSELRPFSAESIPAWKRVVRKIIRQQLPEFHKGPEWVTQRASAVARGRDTPGEIQNAILDDICSALERLAPLENLPKSTC